ncbi:hypothetical protein Tco_0807423, partial [Tanacetum coccineum]
IRGDAASQRLSISDVMVPLIEPLSAENLVGEANTPVSDYEVVDTEPQAEASFSLKIIFEQDTLPERPAT